MVSASTRKWFDEKLERYQNKFSEPLTRKQACEVLLDDRFPKGYEAGEHEKIEDVVGFSGSDDILMDILDEIISSENKEGQDGH